MEPEMRVFEQWAGEWEGEQHINHVEGFEGAASGSTYRARSRADWEGDVFVARGQTDEAEWRHVYRYNPDTRSYQMHHRDTLQSFNLNGVWDEPTRTMSWCGVDGERRMHTYTHRALDEGTSEVVYIVRDRHGRVFLHTSGRSHRVS